MKRFGIAALAVLAVGGCAAAPPAPLPAPMMVTEPVNVLRDPHWYALAWMQTSAEYIGTARGIYAGAALALDRALADPAWTAAEEQQDMPRDVLAALPPAVILDIDETVLDNAPLTAMMAMEPGVGRRAAMADWFARGDAEPIPGALEFLAAAEAKGVALFYITNRDPDQEAATRRNLALRGVTLPEDLDTVFTQGERPGWEGGKSARRAEVARTHRILLLVGDDFGDFSGAFAGTVEARRAAAEARASWWGERWFILPNPLYGSWERAVFFGNGDRGGRQPPEEQRLKAREAIHGFTPVRR